MLVRGYGGDVMATFKPTAEQQKFIETANRRFETWLAQPKRPVTPFSRYFLEKCSSELGIEPRRTHVSWVRQQQRRVLEGIISLRDWLIRLFRSH